MSDFRGRLGTQLTAASKRLVGGAREADFRSRFAVQLTRASLALADARAPARAQDFRSRLGIQLTAAAAALAAERESIAVAGDFRVRLGAALTAAATGLIREREAATPPWRDRFALPRIAWMPRVARPRLTLMPRLTRPLAVALAFTVLGGGAAASSVWLVEVGNPDYGENPGLNSSPPPQAQLNALAVLRRPQTAADRSPGVQTALEDINSFTSGVRSGYVRVLSTTPNGPVVLVPVAQRDARVPAVAGTIGQQAIPDALCLYYPIPAGEGGLNLHVGCWTTEDVIQGRADFITAGHLVGLAPDGDSTATIIRAGAPTVTTAIADNFYDAAIGEGTSLPPTTTPSGGPTLSPAPASPTVTLSP